MSEADRFLKNHLRDLEKGAGHAAPPPQAPPPPVKRRSKQRMVTMAEALKRFWTHWTTDGRASRSEFWWMELFCVLLTCGLGLCMDYIHVDVDQSVVLVCLFVFLFVAFCLPFYCLTVRRLHDSGRSGTCLWVMLLPLLLGNLIVLIPFFGSLLFTVQLCMPSEKRPNRYGPVPNFRSEDEKE